MYLKGQRRKSDILLYHAQPYSLYMESLSEHGTGWQLVSPGDLPVSVIYSTGVMGIFLVKVDFFCMDAEDRC